jgi:hypothetical protein
MGRIHRNNKTQWLCEDALDKQRWCSVDIIDGNSIDTKDGVSLASFGNVGLTTRQMRSLAKWLEARAGEIEESRQIVEYVEDTPRKARKSRA